MLRMLRDPLLALWLLSGCNPDPSPGAPPVEPNLPRPLPPAAAPVASPGPSAASRSDLKALLARMAFKPDPYAGPTDCLSEPLSLVKDSVLLTVRIRLGRAADGSLAAVEPAYQVSDSAVRPPEPVAASLGIPRLELVRADGSASAVDFRGEYVEPGSSTRRLTSEQTPRDPTWVPAWFASAPIGADVVAHRVSLDGRVLSEVKRPPSPPALSHIECDDARSDGLTVRWRAHSDDARAPLLVDVLRSAPLGLIEALPSSDARSVDKFTLPNTPQGETKDALLLVSVTDTFRLVSRGVLVPKAAL
jgi:hypothetical protein